MDGLGPQRRRRDTYEGDLRLDTARATGLTFRAAADGSVHYTANIDAGGLVKLWRPGRDLATYATPIQFGRSYHLKVFAAGSRIQVYLDHSSSAVIDVTDTAYAGGSPPRPAPVCTAPTAATRSS